MFVLFSQHARQMLGHQLFSTAKTSSFLLHSCGYHLRAFLEQPQLQLPKTSTLLCQQGSESLQSAKSQLNLNIRPFPSNYSSLHATASHQHSDELLQDGQQPNTNQSSQQHSTNSLPQPRESFIDYVCVTATGGRGGNGAVSYTRVARGRYLAAAGGDGAKGGNVILKASRHLTELHGIPRHARGGEGGSGGRNCRTGAQGKDTILHVPTGTIVYELLPREDVFQDTETEVMQEQDVVSMHPTRVERHQADMSAGKPTAAESAHLLTESDKTDLRQKDMQAESMQRLSVDNDSQSKVIRPPRQSQVLAELLVDGQQLVVAMGGQGGRGNASQQTQGHKPYLGPSTDSTPGEVGTTIDLLLELKLLADIGFVGVPNAGKSSLLSALTAAKAKVGDYAFTTLRPQLGTLVFDDGDEQPHPLQDRVQGAHDPLPRILTVADIPGLVEGAHVNRGRGNAFLRHVERVHCVAYVIDLSGGQEGALVALTPQQQLNVLQDELNKYRSSLANVPCVIAANKADVCQHPQQALTHLAAITPHPIVPVSALHRAGLSRLRQALRSVAAQQAVAARQHAMGYGNA